jgi:sulfofructose kinase
MSGPCLVCVGHAALDHVWEVQAFPATPTKTPARGYRMQGGGMAFNAAIAAARLGARVRLVTRVGDDTAAAYLRDRLQHEGVDISAVDTVPGTATSVSAVIVDDHGQRQIYNQRGDAIGSAHALDEAVLAGAQAILVDPRWVPGAEAALKWARRHGVLSVLDADVAPQADLQNLVPLADWAAFSESGLASWAPGIERGAALDHAVALGARRALVTLGEQGSQRSDGRTRIVCPTPVVRPRDTTAAGDVFHGALTLALAEGQDEDGAVRFASAAAALKCERGLGALGAPTRHELEQWNGRRAASTPP